MSGFGTSAWSTDPFCVDTYSRTGESSPIDRVTAPTIRNGDYVLDNGVNVQSSPTLERVLFALSTKKGTFKLVNGRPRGDGAIDILVNTATSLLQIRGEVLLALQQEIASKRVKNVQVVPNPTSQNDSNDVNQFMVTYEANDA